MKRSQIPSQEQMRLEIYRSHQRSRDYGVDPFTIDPEQICLDAEALDKRITENRLFFDLASRQMNDLHQITRDGGFTLILVDADGYILYMLGNPEALDFLAPTNCSPGYRWTEQDVGTTAIALCLARKITVQITEKDFFCSQREKSFVTNSASPIFGPDDQLLGVVARTGGTVQVHRHTLGMMLTAARAIENEFKVLKKKDEILTKNRFMQHLIESIDQGVMILDRQGRILLCNTPGQNILQTDNGLVGHFIQDLTGPSFHWQEALKTSSTCVDCEVFFQLHEDKTIQSLATLHAIHDAKGHMEGLVFSFTKIDRIRKIVNKMAGSHALFTLKDIIGTSPAIEKARQLAKQAALSPSNVLITGETGTGKELFAQSIHNYGTRHNRPFVAINCGAIPAELLESELFGYTEGAFTGAAKGGRPGKFELADGGTIFLDEIGDMPLDMQVKLLRVLQSGEVTRIGGQKSIHVDIRIIAATNRRIQPEAKFPNFRPDLYYRLNVLPIDVPPLRERDDDVLLLSRNIVQRRSRALGKGPIRFSQAAANVLMRYAWPGNVRELENVMERLISMNDGPIIQAEHLSFLNIECEPHTVCESFQENLLCCAERQTIQDVMKQTGGNIARASKMLGISRPTLYKKIRKYKLHFQA